VPIPEDEIRAILKAAQESYLKRRADMTLGIKPSCCCDCHRKIGASDS